MASSEQAYERRPAQARERRRDESKEGPSLVEKAWDVQHRLEARTKRLGSGRYARVLKMARKPEPEEFQRSAKITGIGLFVVGLVGFAIFLVMQLLANLIGVE